MKRIISAISLAIFLLLALGCSAEYDGCSVEELEDGSARIMCPDGSGAVVPAGERGETGQAGEEGEDGDPGSSCTVSDNGEGSRVITCDDGTEVTVEDGEDGAVPSGCGDGVWRGHIKSYSDLMLFEGRGCEFVAGNIDLYRIPALTDLSSLDSLKEVWGDLFIGKVWDLETAELPSLEFVGGKFEVSDNTSLTHLNGPYSQSEFERIVVKSNENLETLSGFDSATESNIFGILENDSLNTVEGFGDLENVEQEFSVFDNPNLSQCWVEDLFSQIETDPDYVDIEGNGECST